MFSNMVVYCILASALHLRCNTLPRSRCCLDHAFSHSQEALGMDAGAGTEFAASDPVGCLALGKLSTILSLLPSFSAHCVS